jgi:hypothetical protein
MIRARRPSVGVTPTRATNPTTRRGTPKQDRTPVDLCPIAPAATDVPSEGHPPAHSRHAISTRVHQRGGAPIRHAPMRRGHQAARPPPKPRPYRPPSSLRRPIIHSRMGASRALRVADAISLRLTLDPLTRPQTGQRSKRGRTLSHAQPSSHKTVIPMQHPTQRRPPLRGRSTSDQWEGWQLASASHVERMSSRLDMVSSLLYLSDVKFA